MATAKPAAKAAAKTPAKAAAAPVKTPNAASAAAAGDTTVIVHAYRRKPHFVVAKDGQTMVEGHVEVEIPGVGKAKFISNDEGHIVAECPSALAAHLTKKIPEAYIVYAQGENVPTGPVPGTLEHKESTPRPAGQFVLRNAADGEYIVLDDMSDEDVRAFALDVASLEEEAVPDVLTGEALKQTVYNLLQATSNA